MTYDQEVQDFLTIGKRADDEIERLTDENGELTAQIVDLDELITVLRARVDTLNAKVSTLTAMVNDDAIRIAAIQQAFDEYRAEHPDDSEPTEPTGPDLVSITNLGTGPLNKRMDLLATGKGITFPPGTISDPDANYPSNYPVYTYFLAKPTKIIGSGRGVSILEIKPGSLTQSYLKLDTQSEPATNPYRIMRVDKATVVSDFTLRGTNQGVSSKTGKPYSMHGLQFFAAANPTIRNVDLIDIPGSAGVPPDETFSLEAYMASGTFTVEDVRIWGQLLEGSSGVTVNNTPKPLAVVLRRVSQSGHPNGSLWTTFNTRLASFLAEDCVSDGSMCGFNFEHVNVNGGTAVNNAKDSGIVLRRPDIRNPSNRYYPGAYSHLAIDASSAAGGVSNRVDIYDPVGISASNPFGVTRSQNYGYSGVPSGPNAQKFEDIHLWVNGVERPDLILWRRTKPS